MTGIPVAVAELVGVDYLNEVMRGHWRSSTLIDEVSTVTETDWIGTQGSGFTIPANTLASTSELWVEIIGDFKIASGTSPTNQFRMYLGGTKYLDATLAVAGGGLIAIPFFARLRLKMMGATNSVLLVAELEGLTYTDNGVAIATGLGSTLASNGPTGSSYPPWVATSNGPQTVDMTLAQALRFTHTWGTSNANNEIRIRHSNIARF